jgi:hypothetical protein
VAERGWQPLQPRRLELLISSLPPAPCTEVACAHAAASVSSQTTTLCLPRPANLLLPLPCLVGLAAPRSLSRSRSLALLSSRYVDDEAWVRMVTRGRVRPAQALRGLQPGGAASTAVAEALLPPSLAVRPLPLTLAAGGAGWATRWGCGDGGGGGPAAVAAAWHDVWRAARASHEGYAREAGLDGVLRRRGGGEGGGGADEPAASWPAAALRAVTALDLARRAKGGAREQPAAAAAVRVEGWAIVVRGDVSGVHGRPAQPASSARAAARPDDGAEAAADDDDDPGGGWPCWPRKGAVGVHLPSGAVGQVNRVYEALSAEDDDDRPGGGGGRPHGDGGGGGGGDVAAIEAANAAREEARKQAAQEQAAQEQAAREQIKAQYDLDGDGDIDEFERGEMNRGVGYAVADGYLSGAAGAMADVGMRSDRRESRSWRSGGAAAVCLSRLARLSIYV